MEKIRTWEPSLHVEGSPLHRVEALNLSISHNLLFTPHRHFQAVSGIAHIVDILWYGVYDFYLGMAVLSPVRYGYELVRKIFIAFVIIEEPNIWISDRDRITVERR